MEMVMQNQRLRLILEYEKHSLLIKELSNIPFGRKSNENVEPFILTFMDEKLTSKDFDVELTASAADKTCQLATFVLTNREKCIKVRLHFINNLKDTINILYQVWDDYREGVPYKMYFHSPLLADMRCGDGEQEIHMPSKAVADKNGKNVLCLLNANFGYGDANLPFVTCENSGSYGFSVLFPTKCDVNDNGSQNRNVDFFKMTEKEQLENHNICINPDASFNDAVEFSITGLVDGWSEAFDRFRRLWQQDYDFTEYDREDLQWIKEGCLHNFCFFYGDEAFDHETGRIDVDRLLKQGEEFGGYDTVCFWNQYPRLGVDDRDQWDFHSQLPFGREDEKRAIEEFHSRGVKVLMPFIPWDQHPDKSSNKNGDEFAGLLADTGADGYQLDTLSVLPYSYRLKTDAIRPGILLQTQSHPEKKHYMEFLTSSWDEFWYNDCMPEIDLLRFLLPDHIAPQLSRWLRKEDKDVLIKRAVFGAAGLVIWQDIFGRWMPFSDSQKATIKKWKQTYMTYRDTYLTKTPIPLYPTKNSDIYCNVFEGNENIIYSIYSDADQAFDGILLNLRHGESNCKIVFGDAEAKIENDKLKVAIEPGQVIHVLCDKGKNQVAGKEDEQ